MLCQNAHWPFFSFIATDPTLPAPPVLLLQPVFLLAHGNGAGDTAAPAFLPQNPKLTARRNGRVPSDREQGLLQPSAFLFAPGVLHCGDGDVLVAAVNCRLLSLLEPRAPSGILLPPGAQQGQQLPRAGPDQATAEGMPQGSEDRLWARRSLETQGSGTAQPGLCPMAMF